jgi:hypothetical protein
MAKIDFNDAPQEIAHLSQVIQRLSEAISRRDSLLTALADATQSLVAKPETLARALDDDGGEMIRNGEEAANATLRRLRYHLQLAAHEMAENRHAIQVLRDSWSWKLAGPLRALLDLAFNVFRLARTGGFGLLRRSRVSGLAQWILFGREIHNSGLFDGRYYLARNSSVAGLRINPLLHFFVLGAEEGRSPHSLFDTRYYREHNPDVVRSAINPLVHYLKWGAYEGRDPHPQFDSSFYLEQNPDVREGRLNPLIHYLAPGTVEGRDPNPWFDTSEYFDQNPDVAAFGLNPLAHHLEQDSHRRSMVLPNSTDAN